MKDISVIVLSYNHFSETTEPCLNRLFSLPERDRIEIIVVDNGSEDAWVKNTLQKWEDEGLIKLALLNENKGFAAGNNHGIKLSTTDFIVLLNSDTEVMEGALPAMREALFAHEKLGMLSPMTNAAGNEQMISQAGDTVDEVFDYAQRWLSQAGDGYLRSERLDFCCVGIKRSVIEQVGDLDEDFGLGYYEDFDYSLRVRKAGYCLGVLEGAFIFHKGSASFNALSETQRKALRKNKDLLKAKHGHDIVFPHLRDQNLAVMEGYLQKFEQGEYAKPELSKLYWRFNQRLVHARGLHPKSFFKKRRYKAALDKLEERMMEHLRRAVKPVFDDICKEYSTHISDNIENFDGSQVKEEFYDCVAVLNMLAGGYEGRFSFLEIGAFKGLWALTMLCIARNHGIGVDYATVTWMDSDDNNQPLLKVRDYYHSLGMRFDLVDANSTLEQTRQELVDKVGDSFLFTLIDADHAYDSVMKDIQLYANMAREVLLFHDINTKSCGVAQAVKDSGVELDKRIIYAKIMGIGMRFIR